VTGVASPGPAAPTSSPGRRGRTLRRELRRPGPRRALGGRAVLLPAEAQVLIEDLRTDYNHHQPHSSIQMMTPLRSPPASVDHLMRQATTGGKRSSSAFGCVWLAATPSRRHPHRAHSTVLLRGSRRQPQPRRLARIQTPLGVATSTGFRPTFSPTPVNGRPSAETSRVPIRLPQPSVEHGVSHNMSRTEQFSPPPGTPQGSVNARQHWHRNSHSKLRNRRSGVRISPGAFHEGPEAIEHLAFCFLWRRPGALTGNGRGPSGPYPLTRRRGLRPPYLT
jgi:hypothetical protein